MTSTHQPVVASLRVGGWDVSMLCEQGVFAGVPAEDAQAFMVHGRLRLVVVDPAINAMLPGRDVVAAHAWGRVLGHLRSNPDPVAALHAANADVFDVRVGWMGGAMLCVAVVDLDPRAPIALASARAGDTEVLLDRPVLTGSCFTSDATGRLTAARRGVSGSDPIRWRIQMDTLADADYTCTPLGLVESARLETWGPTATRLVAVGTDGAAGSDGLTTDLDELQAACRSEAAPGFALPHGDRAVVVARFVG